MDLLAAEITARTGKDPGEHYRELDGGVRRAVLHAHRRAGDAGAEGAAAEAVARGGQGIDAGRRADHRQADPRPGQRRADRRPEGRDRERLVRGPALRHREHLQDLRGELQGRGAPRRDRGRGSGHGGQCHGILRMSDRGAGVSVSAGIPASGAAARRNAVHARVRMAARPDEAVGPARKEGLR